MVKEFSFGNYRSFKEIQSLNMTASKIKEHTDNNIIVINEKESLLKSKAIYGANASGKSNIVKALILFIDTINTSVKNEKALMKVDEFKLSDETKTKPTFFQLIFEISGIQYRYGYEATNEIITSEWLFGTPNEREVTYFIREYDKIIEINKKHFPEGNKLVALDVFRDNSLFLSTVAFLKGELSRQIMNEINSITILNGLEDKKLIFAGEEIKNEEKKSKIVDFLKIADIGIDSVTAFKLTKDLLDKYNKDGHFDNLLEFQDIEFLMSTHTVYNTKKEKTDEIMLPFDGSQSAGTKKMFELSPFIIDAITAVEHVIRVRVI